MLCRFCEASLSFELIDLGTAPPSNSYLTQEELGQPELYLPLKVFVCTSCYLVQLDEVKKSAEIFNERYAYFSSYSKSWLEHCELYAQQVVERFALGKQSMVVEVASNDGYLLQYFLRRGIPVLGIEPSERTAQVAIEKGIRTVTQFFGSQFATNLRQEGVQANLLIANNVLAHVPNLRDFVQGLATILAADGVATLEFPHLMRLMEQRQFDTIYHEHYSYFSLSCVRQIFQQSGLDIFDVEEIPTHGGSLRIFAQRIGATKRPLTAAVQRLLDKEQRSGVQSLEYYKGFQAKAETIKYELIQFLIEQKRAGRIVVAYGAAAKGNTLLNYAGVRKDLIAFVVDRSPYKQNLFLPGSRIPICSEAALLTAKPDIVMILPWNLKEEIMTQLAYTRDWGSKFLTAIPAVELC